jgi:NAD(P)-dependent dehydrogenase (short-subunit alcohol dehydrogenase family)
MLTTTRAKRVALITGATHGIGYQVARALAASGANVIVHARTRDEGHQTIVRLIQDGIDPLTLQAVVGDFGRLDDVRALAGRVTGAHSRIDLLVNNAATVGGFRRRMSGDGHEVTLQVNYLAHYLLTRLLWRPLCNAPRGRVVNLSSAVHRDGHLNWDDLDKEGCYAPTAAYAQSKLAFTMLTQALAAQSPGTASAVSVHPGVIATGTMQAVYGRYGAPVGDGAEAVLRLCDADSEIHNGGYYEGGMLATPAALVHDPASVDRLWRLSAGLTGFPPADSDGPRPNGGEYAPARPGPRSE